jgi:hypothetical protein
MRRRGPAPREWASSDLTLEPIEELEPEPMPNVASRREVVRQDKETGTSEVIAILRRR